ncbi:ELWxxDGT repeat protein [Nocardioides sp. SYSU D00038]|uniref:ELWxxDGT repeat protein n=1 Tax=Nocardioides sp. SYSU D00038 TaxID=2812554 RepID=UPI00196880CA|nr:ELWxxDGT repeat protein [Nocardioides sp. SYSU D00038]
MNTLSRKTTTGAAVVALGVSALALGLGAAPAQAHGNAPLVQGATFTSQDPLAGVAAVGTKVVFAAEGVLGGTEPWVTDGTAAGTFQLKDVFAGPNPSSPEGFTTVGNKVYFSAFTTGTGRELYVTDGTQAGTKLVEDIRAGGSSNPEQLTAAGGQLLFTADDGDHGVELWRSAGTAATTSMVEDLSAGGIDTEVTDIVGTTGNRAMLAAGVSGNNVELYKTDGVNDVSLVKDINDGFGSNPAQLTHLANGLVVFVANDGIKGTELWRSNGTEAGTVIAKDFNPQDSAIQNITKVGTRAFMSVEAGNTGFELYVTNGSATTPVKDIFPGPGDSSPKQIVDAAGQAYFVADHPTSGQELWTSNGTAAGTRLVKDIAPGNADSSIAGLSAVGRHVAFGAVNNLGAEPWISNGYGAGTLPVKDVQPGPQGSSTRALVGFGGKALYRGLVQTKPTLFSLDVKRYFTVSAGKPTTKVVGGGKVKVGKKLRANPGAWEAGTKLTYKWLRNGKPIAGANGKTYKLKSKDKGKKIKVRVTGSLAGHEGAVRYSAPKKVKKA